MSCGGPTAQANGVPLAEVLRAGLSAAPPRLPSAHWRVLNALLACRTPALGGHRYWCQDCDRTHFVPHSCRNRHCPLCQGQAARAWLKQQQEALLPVPYFHVVFTLPHDLNPLLRQNQSALYRLLFDAVSQTLLEFGRHRFGAQLGVTAVLHTWSQTLLDHYHLHCIVTGGGLTPDGAQWVAAQPHYLFPVKALSAVYRGKFCTGLHELYAAGGLQFHGQLVGLARRDDFQRLVQQAGRHPWVVYAKRPFAGPQQVLAYLSRYTHRVAITPSRLRALDPQARTVAFTWKDYADGSKRKTMTLSVTEFLRRFCLHLLPERFVKIRHYGLHGNRQRHSRLAQAWVALAQESRTSISVETGITDPLPKPPPPRVCPFCSSQRLWLVEIVPPVRRPLVLLRPLDSS